MRYIIIPPQGFYRDFATVMATADTRDEAIATAEREGGVAYAASGYGMGAKVPRTAIDQMRAEGRIAEKPDTEPLGTISRLGSKRR